MNPLNSIGRKAVQAFDELGQAPAPRRFFPQEAGDTGSSFPYGSEWWMGYTFEETPEAPGVYVHNIGLHYNMGFVAGTSVEPVLFPIGTDTTVYIGFSLDLATGEFAPVSASALTAFSKAIPPDQFLFPVYQFRGAATPSGTPTMVADYVHGSNIGW